MIQSFDWITKARNNPKLKKDIISFMETGNHSIIIDRFQIIFSSDPGKATVKKVQVAFQWRAKLSQ